MLEHTLFLSYSFSEKEEIVNFFDDILKSFGFSIHKHTHRESDSLNKEIIDNINHKDAFVAIVSAVDNKISDWIISEIAVANIYRNKQILLFIEREIKSSFLDNLQCRKIYFDKNNLVNNLFDIIKTVYLFKESLIGDVYFPFCEQEKFIQINRIIDKENYELNSRVKIKVLNENLRELIHSSNALNESVDLRIVENTFYFDCISKPENCEIKGNIKKNTKSLTRVAVNIIGNLKKYDIIEYSYGYIRKNYKAYTYEEALAKNKTSYYEDTYNKTAFARANVYIEYPTKELLFKVQFPKNYKISQYGVFVFMTKTSTRDFSEEERANKYINLIDEINKQTLTLELKNPKLNCNYHLYWQPPKEKYIKGNK